MPQMQDIHVRIMPETASCPSLPVEWPNGKQPAPSTLVHGHCWLLDKQ